MNAKSQALSLQTMLFLPQRSSSHSTARRTSFPLKIPSPPPPPPPLPFLRRSSVGISRNPNLKAVEGVRFDGPVIEIGEVAEVSDEDFAVEICITRSFPPAVTLERGIESIRDAIEALKLDPPSSSSGFLRFQVTVPPSAKALGWFCSQPESSSVFPLFFVSKETDGPSYKSLLLNETRGVFGIGTSVYFARDSSRERTQSVRYFSSESTPILAYGFVDSSFGKEFSIIKHEAGSYYFFIPQIELDECEGFSVLSATLVWCDSYLSTFEEAVQSLELSFIQALSHLGPTAGRYYTRNIVSTLRKLNPVDGIIQKVYMNTLTQGVKYFVDGIKEMKEASSSGQFCLRLSPSVVVARNMLNDTSGLGFSVQDCANINTLWASLVIEEFFRLGLTYFCVAPGSRSSPLTVAASTHPHITSIVCFDERSLAFHAVGYARGSRRPAIVITSSGTAVSNLLPAVVEAHQDFVPLILLTADRPAELLDAGANQAIDQVKHFGSFVRFFSLPAPTDCIPARMVLTTVDSAVHWATSAPGGPVHINCPFREPLENSPRKWTPSCLKGLDLWMSSAEPFTKYVDINCPAPSCSDNLHEIQEVVNVIQKADKGILLIGEIRTVDEMWAVLLMAKHLSWPVIADILSGLRLRNSWASFPEIKADIIFVDHLDHALLSDFFREWMHVDVIVQIGSRITSKRVSKLLERCFPCSYIMVDNHPFRYDPSHIVTHRIQSSIITFSNYLLKFEFPLKKNRWSTCVQVVNMMVARELPFQIFSEYSLTEPQVARIVSDALSSESALFIGNSMPIRDMDMYGSGWPGCFDNTSAKILNSESFCRLIWVVGNRGASGIDGLVSTAVGFAVGCNKRVVSVVGDVSFLHDSNGLAILSQRASRKSMTMVVINNHGGAIFSLLPIAEKTEESIMNKYFYTSHNISIRGLCMAHGVKHVEVQTKAELCDALTISESEEVDSVIEVVSSIDANAINHRNLSKFACQVADDTLRLLLRSPVLDSVSDDFSSSKVHSLKYSTFRIPLCAPPTMTTVSGNSMSFYREGFILSLCLEGGHVGFGEVSPLDISKDYLIDVEEQLRFVLHEMKGVEISSLWTLLKGSFFSWMQTKLGIPPLSLFPSVRCGLEMAILNALAARQGCDLLSLLNVQKAEETLPGVSSKVKVCGLVDSDGTPSEVSDVVAKLVDEGFTAIKLKVARRRSPTQDAEVIQAVRKKNGNQFELRVDANRNWTYEEAIQFASLVKDCSLQYIEEPVKDEADIIKFCEETGLPVALDETIDDIEENPLDVLMKYTHQGIAAIVIKPSVVGGFENAALIAQWAQQHGKMAVISSTFESGLGLSAYIHLSCYLNQKNAELCKLMNNEIGPPVAHGLGTYRWLQEDVATNPLQICRDEDSGFVEASTVNANKLLQSFEVNHNIIREDHREEEEIRRYMIPIYLDGICYQIKVQEMGQESQGNVIVFIHGFLGTSEDWTSIMKAVSRDARCISIDLPGHGGTRMQNHDDKNLLSKLNFSIEVVADIVYEMIHNITRETVTVVGYSMGARIALYMALRFTDKVKGAAVISGSPGIKDEVARKVRRAMDDSRAQLLVSYGLDFFLDTWYAGKLWDSLRDHPKFNQIVQSRLHHVDITSLAKVLSDSSTGRQLPLWNDLNRCKIPLLIIVGEKDEKFRRIAQDMCYELDGGIAINGFHEAVKIPKCGHAVHLENPLLVIRALRRFFSRLRTS